MTIDPQPPGEEFPAARRLGDLQEQAPSPNERRWVVGFLVSAFGLLAAVLALNVTIDPFALAGSGVVPTAVESDRSVKLTLLENLKRGPETLVLGSSRSRQAEPWYLQKLTGHTGFNAGVTGGTTADEYVYVALRRHRSSRTRSGGTSGSRTSAWRAAASTTSLAGTRARGSTSPAAPSSGSMTSAPT